MKFQKKKLEVGSGGGGGLGQVGRGGGVGGGVWLGLGGQGGCERRIEVFVKIQKKKWGGGRGGRDGSGWGVSVDVIKELKFL